MAHIPPPGTRKPLGKPSFSVSSQVAGCISPAFVTIPLSLQAITATSHRFRKRGVEQLACPQLIEGAAARYRPAVL